MKRNEIVTKLIAEGFTEKTLVSMNDKQLYMLSKRILKEQSGVPTINIPKEKTPEIQNAQKSRQTFVTYEGEVKEEKTETKESARTFANQNRKNMPQGTKFQAGRANKNKFKKDQVTTVKQITRPFEDMGKTGLNRKEITEKTVVSQFVVTVKHDKGTTNIKTSASSKEAAIKNVMKAEGCPRNAITRVVNSKDTTKKKGKPEQKPKSLKENNDVKKWVEGLVQENYHSMTTKNEIMEVIKQKLTEQAAEPDVAPPKTRPGTKPGREATPDTPKKNPYPNPWEPPKPGLTPDPTPKYEDDEEMPEFLLFDNIVMSLNESKIDRLTSIIVERIKSEKKKLREQAFNDAGEPLMTHQQYNDYSEPSEPEYGDDDGYEMEGKDALIQRLSKDLRRHDLYLETFDGDEYFIRCKENNEFLIYASNDETIKIYFNDEEHDFENYDDAGEFILKNKNVLLSFDESVKERKQEESIDSRDKHTSRMESGDFS